MEIFKNPFIYSQIYQFPTPFLWIPYISDVLQWTPSHGRIKAGQSARNYIQQLSADTGCSTEDQSEAMDDREGW